MISAPQNIDAVAAMSRGSDPKAVATAMFEMMTTDLRPQLGRICVPTLVLAAAAPQLPDEARKTYETQYAGLKGHRLVVAERSRHFIMLDDPPFFFAQLDPVLGKKGGR